MIHISRKFLTLGLLFFIASAAIAGPKTIDECINLLHSNYKVIKLGFPEVKAPTGDETRPQRYIELAPGKDLDNLYGADTKIFGAINGKTGRVKTIYEAKGENTLENLTSTEKHVAISVHSNQRIIGQIFVDRISGANKNLKLPAKSVLDYRWHAAGREIFPFAAGDKLGIYDITSGKTRSLRLPFVPTQISYLGKSDTVAILAPGKPPFLINIITGEKVAIPGLSKVKMAKTGGNGFAFQTQTQSRLYLAHPKRGTLEIDISSRTSTQIDAPEPDLKLDRVIADGEFFLYNREIRQPPPDLTDDELLAWYQRNHSNYFNRTSLVERKSGKFLIKNSYVEVNEAPGGTSFFVSSSIMRRMPGQEEAYMSDGTNMFLWTPGSGFKKIADAKEVIYVDTIYNPYNDTWMCGIYPNRQVSNPTNGKRKPAPSETSRRGQYLQVYDKDGNPVQRLDDFKYTFARDSRDKFLGFYSGEFEGGKDLLKIALPNFTTAAKTPVAGWGKAAKILAAPMTVAQAKANYPYLIAFFESGAYRRYPKHVTGAFLNLFSVSNGFSGDVLRRFADLEALLAKNPLDVKSMTAAEQKLWKSNANGYLRLLQLGSTFMDSHMAHIRALSPFLKDFSPAKAEALVDTIAEAAKVTVMQQIHELRDVFSSKIYKIIRRNITEDFNIKESPITDATQVQDETGIRLYALGSKEIDGGTKTRFGLEYKKLFEKPVPQNAGKNQVIVDESFAWKHHGKKFTVDFRAQTTDKTLDDIVEFTQGPNYPAHWKDGKFTTMVITGTNLFDDAKSTLDEYLSYFLDRGYKFDDKVDNIKDVLAYMKGEIEGGRVDMLVKEAHSDGDEKNLFRIFKTSDLRIGRRTLPDGREEVVHLVYPDKTASGGDSETLTRLIPNDEFGGWMRARDATATPLIYMNVSCSSYTKAANEIQAALTRTLVVVASKNLIDTFTNETDAAMYHLINSTLEGQNYSQTLKAMEIDPENKAGNGNNVVFPNSADPEPYRETVLKGIRIPLTTKAIVKDQNGKVIDIDAHQH